MKAAIIMSALSMTAMAVATGVETDRAEAPRHIVLIHGIDSRGSELGKMRRHLEHNGFAVHQYTYSPSDGSHGLEEPARGLTAFVERELPAGTRFSLVAFSMGGLISRWYLDMLGGAERVARFVTISSPHNGTLMGYLRANKGARELRPGSDFLRRLEAHNGPIQRGEIEAHSFWTPFDLMIVPSHSSVVPWAQCRQFGVLAHPLMLRDRHVLDAVTQVLQRPLPIAVRA